MADLANGLQTEAMDYCGRPAFEDWRHAYPPQL